jgi:hypothetical protein
MAVKFIDNEPGHPGDGFMMLMPDGDFVEVALYPEEYSKDGASHLSIIAANTNEPALETVRRGIELQTREEWEEFYHKLGKLLGLE